MKPRTNRPAKGHKSGPFRMLGNWVGGAVDKFVGTGDYKISRNTVLRPSNIPEMHNASNTTIVRHREYITDIRSNTALAPSIVTFSLNPGLYTTLPWLAGVAKAYEMYRLRGAVFEFKSLSGDVTTASNQGYIVAAINYNPTGGDFITKAAIENAMGGQSTKPSEDMFIPVECKPQLNPLGEYFVRDGPVTSTQNLNFYDVGKLVIATGSNPTSGVALGELWLTYEVELAKPATDNTSPTDADGAHLTAVSVSNAIPWGTEVFNTSTFNTLGAYTSAVSHKLIIPAQQYSKYAICCTWVGTVAVTTVRPSFTFINCAAYNTYWSKGALPSNDGQLEFSLYLMLVITVTDPSLAVEVTLGTGGTLPGGTLSLDTLITPLPGSLSASLDAKRAEPLSLDSGDAFSDDVLDDYVLTEGAVVRLTPKAAKSLNDSKSRK